MSAHKHENKVTCEGVLFTENKPEGKEDAGTHKTKRSDRGRDGDGDTEARKLWCWFLMGVNFEGDSRGRLDTVV